MLRLEKGYPPTHSEDQDFEYAEECDYAGECLSDACSITTDDDAQFPTGSNWRSKLFNRTEDGSEGAAEGSSSAGEEDEEDEDAEGEKDSSFEDVARPPKRQRLASPAHSPPAPPPESSSDLEDMTPAPEASTSRPPGADSVRPKAKSANVVSPASVSTDSNAGLPAKALPESVSQKSPPVI
ncbi:hypothetical protein V565_312750, partial [Rhizoctonia solani 123E]